MITLQKHQHDPNMNESWWEITFVQISLVSLTMEEYHEVSQKLDKIIEEIEHRRVPMGSNNQYNK